MYHLKFSFRGGASSCSGLLFQFVCHFLRLFHGYCGPASWPIRFVSPRVKDVVHGPEIEGKDEDRHQHHSRSRLNFLARGRNHLAHFGANIGQKVARPIIGRRWYAQPAGWACFPAGSLSTCLRRLMLSLPYCYFLLFSGMLRKLRVMLNLAGAEGFEPPSQVLETRSLTVELTPLKAAFSY